jgi:hypothetical protein
MQLLTLDNISALDDGKIAKTFDKLFSEAVADCHARAGHSSERVITMQVMVKPVLDEDVGGCDRCKVRFQLATKLPKRMTASYDMGRKHDNKLVFNNDSLHDSRQRTLDVMRDGSERPPLHDRADDLDDDLDDGGEE